MSETKENLLAESRIRLYIAAHEYCRNHCHRTSPTWCQDCVIKEKIPTLSLLIRGFTRKCEQMKLDREGRLMAKLATAFFSGATLAAFLSVPDVVAEKVVLYNYVIWAFVATTAFFFGFGWLTDEES